MVAVLPDSPLELDCHTLYSKNTVQLTVHMMNRVLLFCITLKLCWIFVKISWFVGIIDIDDLKDVFHDLLYKSLSCRVSACWTQHAMMEPQHCLLTCEPVSLNWWS